MSLEQFARLQLARAHFGCLPWQLNAEQGQELAQQVQRKLQLERLVLAHPLAESVQVSEQEVEGAERALAASFGGTEMPGEVLARLGLATPGLLRHALRHELQVSAVLLRAVEQVPRMSEPEARRYYLDHPRRFLRPAQREVRHLLLTVDEQDTQQQDQAWQQIRQLRSQLLAEPHLFGDLALRYSECPTAMERGRIGWVRAGQLFPELDSVLFTLQVGELSEPVSSPMGWHLLQCLGVREAEPIPLDEALPQIIEQQWSFAREQAQRRWLRMLQRQEAAQQEQAGSSLADLESEM